ncbi:ABC transporter permease [Sporomusa sp.]|uniref:ABC transporter permease n=1 Tax=Sporomusa sp. TaxID=2078658 RepID=UPI002C36C86C|nr:ABC transporter permease [Sporomusa sp.]HWR09460.1 ABC transporter permease [Sporomusa sp.]
MDNTMGQGIILGIVATGIRLATPYLLAALGEMFTQRSGIYNLGLEGVMLIGAFFGFFVTLTTGNAYIGLVIAMVAGAAMGLIMGVVSITLKAEQGISGIGLYLLGWGIAGLFYRLYVGGITTIKGLEPISIPVLSDIPVVGQAFFSHTAIVYLAFLLVPVCWVVLFKTNWGLKVRAVGTTPQAADTLGVSVNGIRYQCLILGGMMAGLAGAALTVGNTHMFADNITAGRGFIAVALVYFGRWSPWGILAGSLLFSMADSVQLWVQVLGINFPYELAVILPYVVTIVALAMTYGRIWAPAALGRPYDRGARG